MLNIHNPILDTDSYKFTHPLQYPEGTEEILCYIESRGGPTENPGTLFFGLQLILNQLKQKITKEDVEEAKAFVDAHIGPGIFPYEDWMYVVQKYDGSIPLEIKAVPEGTFVPSHNVLVTVRSTDPRLFWMTSWFETQLLRVWYPITVSTISNRIKELIYKALVKTSDDPDSQIDFKLHDFGARGVSSRESAAIGGAAHLANFMGSDTVVGVLAANKYYGSAMAGFSIPAAEHSTITTWGKDNEAAAFRMMLERFNTPLVAVVSDSYDLDNAVQNIWGDELKAEVIKSGKAVVVRPDSGSPIEEIVLRTVKGLADKYGYTVNNKGYKVLNNVRVIQGDGIEEATINKIIERVCTHAGFSLDNIAFGMGGALLQQCNRDTYKFAYKASLAKVNGVYRDVSKNPKTDPGKKSKSGDLDLVWFDGKYITIDRRLDFITPGHPSPVEEVSQLQLVYRNGELFNQTTIDEVRRRVNQRTFGW